MPCERGWNDNKCNKASMKECSITRSARETRRAVVRPNLEMTDAASGLGGGSALGLGKMEEEKPRRKDIHGAFSESLEEFFPRQRRGILQEQLVVGLNKLEVFAQTVGSEVVYPEGRDSHQPREC